jgi:hypothetical protein
MNNIRERLELIEEKISNPDFLGNRRIANEVGYYVFDYDAEDELQVRNYVNFLISRIEKSNNDFVIVKYDVYDIMIDFIKEEGLLEACFDLEKEEGFDNLANAVVQLLRLDRDMNYFSEFIASNTPDKSVVFITGIGKIFPFVRSHKILNTLGQVFDKVPVVMFYPGKYNGQSLSLFNEFKDDNYYRAFKLVEDL